jgi:hypothetical protein
MLQVVKPTFKSFKELKNLNITISHYVDHVSVYLNDRGNGHMVFNRNFSEYDAGAKEEILTFIKLFDDEIENKSISGSTKLYFELTNYNW